MPILLTSLNLYFLDIKGNVRHAGGLIFGLNFAGDFDILHKENINKR